MNLFDKLSSQITCVGLPLFAVSLTAVPRANTPVMLMLHWHGFRKNLDKEHKLRRPQPVSVPGSAVQINEPWQGVARQLGAVEGNQVVFITQRMDADLPGVRKLVYKPAREVTRGVHHYLRETEAGVLNAQNVARLAMSLRDSGFVPNVMLAHNG